jgi:Polyketide cyclase / dehydrase and lipid transport
MAYEVTTSIEITATPENVWAVLADLAGYPQWHPAFRSVTGQLAVGSKLTIVTTVPSTGKPMTVK